MIINHKKIIDREAGKRVDGDQYIGDSRGHMRQISFYDEAP